MFRRLRANYNWRNFNKTHILQEYWHEQSPINEIAMATMRKLNVVTLSCSVVL